MPDGKVTTIRTICEQEMLPRQFVYRILKKMEKGGLVRIARGKDGGAELATDLRHVSLYDLLAIVNEKRYISACMQPNYECEWRRARRSSCSVHNHLTEIQNNLDKELKKRSLHQILFE